LFKAHGQKYSFIANSHKEQEGWLKALKAEVEAATGKKEEITSSEGYKKTLESLSKFKARRDARTHGVANVSTEPAVVAASVAGAAGTAASAVNPSKTEERETRATNGTTKSKSRSVSRGKGGSIFDRITGKKEEPATEGEPAAAAPATETAEAAKDGKYQESFRNACQCTPTYAFTAPAETAEAAAPVDAAAEEPKKEEVKAEEPKKVEEPKTTRRGSRFGDFLKKIEGKPTVLEKKPAGTKDVAPPVPPKDTEAPKAEDKEEEAATAAVAAAPLPVVATEEVKKEEKETTPAAKPEKKNFFERFIPKEPKAKAPATAPVAKEAEPAKTEETPTIEAPATTEATTEATPAAETTETPAVNGEAKKETLAAEQKEKRRSSFFSGDIAASLKKIGQRAEKAVEPKKEVKAETNGNHAKAEEPVADKPADDKPADETPAVVTTPAPAAAPASKKEKEHQDNPLTKLGRRLSTAFRNTGKDHSKKETPAAKGPETAEPAEAKAEAEEPAKEEETKPAEESKPAETEKPVNSIGDVVPDAVNVGSAPPATATVSATA